MITVYLILGRVYFYQEGKPNKIARPKGVKFVHIGAGETHLLAASEQGDLYLIVVVKCCGNGALPIVGIADVMLVITSC